MAIGRPVESGRSERRWLCRLSFRGLCVFGLFACLSASTLSMPALKRELTVTQPDGASFEATVEGDEWASWTETKQGYVVAKGKDGYWYHVRSHSGSMPVLTSSRADVDAPVDALKSLSLGSDRQPMRFEPHASTTDFDPAPAPPTGAFTGRLLFILVQYLNQPGATSEASWAQLLSKQAAAYYEKASYGSVKLQPAAEKSGTPNNGVVGWLTIGSLHPNTGPFTGAANRQIVKSAIEAADAYVDFASFDLNGDGLVSSGELAVVVVVAGGERAYDMSGNTVWGHAWDIDNDPAVADGKTIGLSLNGSRGYAQIGEKHGDHQATVGIVAHELGHLIFGLPDLYDTDGSSTGIGGWCLMATGGWGQGPRDSFAGQTPVLPSAWVKVALGWVVPQTAGDMALMAAGDAGASATNTVYRIETRNRNEYFLVENRESAGYDKGFYARLGSASWGGLAVYHVDDNQESNATDVHRRVDLEEADGNENYGGTEATDLWYLGGNEGFTDLSRPSSRLYDRLPSGITVRDFSPPGDVMTASVVAAAPMRPTLVSPLMGDNLNTGSPAFEWNAVRGADRYWLQVNSRYGVTLRMSFAKAEAGCASEAGTCSVAPGVPFSPGSFQWRVQAGSSTGDSAWSEPGNFTVFPPALSGH